MNGDTGLNGDLMVICANLERRCDRRFVIANNLEGLMGVSITFVNSVDGDCIPSWKLERFPEQTTKSSYAVRLTKRLALRKFLQSGRKWLLYLEDDVAITEDFEETVFEGIQKGHDVIFLGGNHHEAPEGDGRWRKCRATFNNHALLLSRVGARKLRKVFRRWTSAWSDRELQKAIFEGNVEAWCVEPPVAYQRETKSDNSGNVGSVSFAELTKPHMQPDDLAVLDVALNFCRVVVEYGSGGSTIHMGSRLCDWGRLVSVEHDRDRYRQVQKMLAGRNFPVEQILIEPTPIRAGDGPERYLPRQLESYVSGPLELLGEGEADLVFVDGRERIRCGLASAKILRKGGLLMIHDFWSRPRYRGRLGDLLCEYEYMFETPGRGGGDPQGMAVFRKRDAPNGGGD